MVVRLIIFCASGDTEENLPRHVKLERKKYKIHTELHRIVYFQIEYIEILHLSLMYKNDWKF